MHILVVEDDDSLAQGIATALRQNSYTVVVLRDGVSADAALSGPAKYDMVVLDLTLPGMDGSEVLRRMRERNNRTPVLVLTARATLEDRVLNLNAGADDYVTKPFALAELEARIKALLRRSPSVNVASGEFSIILDAANRALRIGDKSVDLSEREVEIMKALCKSPNEVVKREKILARLTMNEEGDAQISLEVYIHRLRHKLERTGVELKTVRGLGYMLVCPP